MARILLPHKAGSGYFRLLSLVVFVIGASCSQNTPLNTMEIAVESARRTPASVGESLPAHYAAATLPSNQELWEWPAAGRALGQSIPKGPLAPQRMFNMVFPVDSWIQHRAEDSGDGYVTVTDGPFFARCDGASDDTAAIAEAFRVASGRIVLIPAGTCVVDSIEIPGELELHIGSNASLRQREGSTGHMLNFRGSRLSIRGGSIEGNAEGQSERHHLIDAMVPADTQVDISGVRFRGIVFSAVHVQNLGGEVAIDHCRFEEIAAHDGLNGNWTAAVAVESGEPGGRGELSFNHNVVVGTKEPTTPGGSPGGLLFAPTVDYRTGEGNFSTLSAVGNQFFGVGQHSANNSIAAIQLASTANGARIVGNYFDGSGFSAIVVKSVRNFVCEGNVIVDGQISQMNDAGMGAIVYAPGYLAGSNVRPHAVIAHNIIDKPGGQQNLKKDCLSIFGTADSPAEGVVVSGNVVNGCGNGINAAYVKDLVIEGNRIQGSVGGVVGSEMGIRVAEAMGAVNISGNRIDVPNGHGVHAPGRVSNARFVFAGNRITHSSDPTYAIVVRGAAQAVFTGNFLESSNYAVSLGSDGLRNLGRLYWADTNVIGRGRAAIDFRRIDSSEGALFGGKEPSDWVSAPPGTIYRKLADDGKARLYHKAHGLDEDGWVPIGD